MKRGDPKITCIGIIGMVLLTLVLMYLGRRDGGHQDAAPSETLESEVPSTPAAPTTPEVASTAIPESTVIDTQSLIPISFAGLLIDPENGSWLRDQTYQTIPRGTQYWAGVEFHLEGMIQLQGQGSESRNRKYRDQVVFPLSARGITASNIACLHLLGGTRYETQLDARVAEIVWRYEDGGEARTPLFYLNHIRDWQRPAYEEPAHLPYAFSKVVWRKEDPTQAGRWLRLYRVTLANPQPAKTVRELELVSAHGVATLFVVGLTLDRLMPGLRPDDSPDLEPTDALLAKTLDLLVQTSEGKPVSQAKVVLQYRPLNSNGRSVPGANATTDASGLARVGYPPDELDAVEVSASHEDYGGRKMLWEMKAGDVVPLSYVLKMNPSVSLGGVVVNESNAPVVGATISFHRFWRGEDESPRRRGDQADFPNQTRTTDDQGKWLVKGVPAELLGNIGFDVKHPDYVSTNYYAVESASESQLRAGTFKIVLHGGQIVRGRVADERDNAIQGATVWAGRKYFRDRQETTSDAEGRFSFKNVAQGEMRFSVMAPGWKPDNKAVNVRPAMNDIVFRLGLGRIVRARVENESGDGISGARVGLEGDPGPYDVYEFTATTDSQGKFEWNGAPDEPMQFYVFATGYEARRNVKLKPDDDNVVVLHRTRKLEGVVLDANSGQPVTQFRTRTGHRDNPGSENIYGTIDQHEFSALDGRFTLDLREEEDNAVAVSADGYSEQIESFPEAQNGTVQVTVRMKPSGSLDGVVVTSEGAPAPGVTVAVVGPESRGSSIQLSNGRLRSMGRDKVVNTDAAGHFHISSLPEDGTVLAAGEPGSARVPLAQARISPTIVLAPWGRIEGTINIAGKPGAGQELYYSTMGHGVSSDFDGYKSTADAQGHFAIDKVPPGEGSLVRLVKTSDRSWSHSHNTSVSVEPGKTTYVTLGDTGAVLKGNVRFESPSGEDENLVISGSLNTEFPQGLKFDSPEWKEATKQMKHFSVVVKPDGSLMLDSIPPGEYKLRVSAVKSGENLWNQPPVAAGETTITVPDTANPLSPISIGEIILKPVPKGSRPTMLPPGL